MIVTMYNVWKKGIPYLTTTQLDDVIAEEMGFDAYEPKNNGQLQFFVESPDNVHLPKFVEAFNRRGIVIKIEGYTDEKSRELRWELWDGFKFGMKPNEEMQEIAEKLIATEDDHAHLAVARIKYVFKTGNPSVDKNGHYTLAFVQNAPKVAKHLGKWDFMMVTYESIWESLNKEAKKRLIDHELYHLGFKGSPYIIEHDIQEFKRMYEKYDVKVGGDLYLNSNSIVKDFIQQLKEMVEEDRGITAVSISSNGKEITNVSRKKMKPRSRGAEAAA
jgi:hypothetical protein